MVVPPGRRLEVVSVLGPSELLAAVVRTCPMTTRWFGVGEVRVEPFGRGDAAVGLVLGRADQSPRAVFGAAAQTRGNLTELAVGGLERHGRTWAPWRARAYRAAHERFLDAVVAEIRLVDAAAAVTHVHGVVPGETPVPRRSGEPGEGAAPAPRTRREPRSRARGPRADRP